MIALLIKPDGGHSLIRGKEIPEGPHVHVVRNGGMPLVALERAHEEHDDVLLMELMLVLDTAVKIAYQRGKEAGMSGA